MNDLSTITHEGVLEKFLSYPDKFRSKLLFLRKIIFDVAKELYDPIGTLEENLRWGEPAYITSETKLGSVIRIDWKKSYPHQYCMYFNCNTSLIHNFKELYGNKFKYGGNRSIIFFESDKVPVKEFSHCIKLALTYHLKK